MVKIIITYVPANILSTEPNIALWTMTGRWNESAPSPAALYSKSNLIGNWKSNYVYVYVYLCVCVCECVCVCVSVIEGIVREGCGWRVRKWEEMEWRGWTRRKERVRRRRGVREFEERGGSEEYLWNAHQYVLREWPVKKETVITTNAENIKSRDYEW